MFLFKKIFGYLLMPLSIIIMLFFIGVILLRFSRRQDLAKKIITTVFLIMVLLSYGILSHWPLQKLENLYPELDMKTAQTKNIHWVVVLAGSPEETMARLHEGITLYRNLHGVRLLVSGGKVYETDSEPSSGKMVRIAKEAGVKESDITQESVSRDTKDEAKIIKPMIGEEPFILVTSAYHMPRSMLLFRAQGMHPIPSPTDYHIIQDEDFSPQWFFPSSVHIHDAELVVHEVLGILSTKIIERLEK